MKIRRNLIGLAAIICTVGVTPVGAGATSDTARHPRCLVGATGPEIKYPRIYAVGFLCSPERRTDQATVVLQGYINGRWKALATVTKQLKMVPYRKYSLRTPSIHCTSHPHYVHMRGDVIFKAGPPNGTIEVHNQGEQTDCI